MTDENLRKAHEAEQAEMKNELQTESEFNDWMRGWKKQDMEVDLQFNKARVLHSTTVAAHTQAKAYFWTALGGLVWALAVIIALPGTILIGTFVIRYLF